MDETTYKTPEVIALIQSKYIPVRVDQDSRPDLSNRYEDYGWPATIVFNSDGSEIVKRRGDLPPGQMASMLQAIIDDPSPGASVVGEATLVASGETVLGSGRQNALRQTLIDSYDNANRGWGRIQKFLDWNTIEFCLNQTERGDQTFDGMARETLAAQLNLLDPEWGGVYQYSTDGD